MKCIKHWGKLCNVLHFKIDERLSAFLGESLGRANKVFRGRYALDGKKMSTVHGMYEGSG